MAFKVQHLSRFAQASALTVALAISATGLATSAVHAEPRSPDHMTVPCRDGGRWYQDGAIVSDYDEYDGITYYYQCRDGIWEEVMGTRLIRGAMIQTGTVVTVGVLSPR